MAMYTVLLFASCCMGLCSPQLLQPRRIFEKIRALHENSNKLIAREDSMSLYVDISEASKYPLREDLRMRVFNKDSNVTVCDQKMSAYAHIGKFPCTFLASDADLRLGVNHFEFEVYSTLNGRRFASQKIPDIHFFDQYLYEGYYDNFYLTSEFQPYAAKIAVSSLAAVLLAHAIDAGPIALEAEVGSMFGNLVKLPLVAVSTAVIDVSRASTTASVKLFLFFLGAVKNILYALTDGILAAMKGFVHIIGLNEVMGIKSPADFAYLVNLVEARLRYDITSLARSFQFLFDIFCAGISSPISMLTKALEDGLLYFVLFISNLQRKIMFEFSISSTDENSSPPPRKKTQIISLKKVTSTPIIAMKEKEIKVVTALPVPTVAMSRGLYSSVRKTNSQVIVASASPVSIVNKSTPSQPRKWRKTLFRTVGLCLAVVALAPASRNQILSLDLNSVKNSLGKIRFGTAARFFSEKKNNLKARVTRAYKNKFRRIKSTQVLPIYVEDGVLTLQGKGFSEVSVGCPFFTQVHPMK